MTIPQYPTPDPAWDYARLWALLQDSKNNCDLLLDDIAALEESTPEHDAEIRQRLDAIGQQLNSARRLLDE
ncbi:hypothetical protein NIES25_48410 [Nostoc linckia NIES-25]|nr:hypothetical protein NIES25_48410 [Nostoc linckia NIES-25]